MDKLAVVVFSQNLIIESICNIKRMVRNCNKILLLTSHQLFDYEIEQIGTLLEKGVENKAFIDFLSMQELEYCDQEAYKNENKCLEQYDDEIKRIKNQLVVRNFEGQYHPEVKLILCDDLGIDKKVWTNNGYQYVKCKYYYNQKEKTVIRNLKDYLKGIPFVKQYIERRKKDNSIIDEEVYVGYWNSKKYVFIGKMNRVDYRMNIQFTKSSKEAERIHQGEYLGKNECIYLTSLHESYRVNIPDNTEYKVYQIQDGYLPPYYSCSYKFKPDNHTYYVWDIIGKKVFEYLNLPVEIMPFRKKIYFPQPIFPAQIKRVLVVASGAGDWTAMKNRSDEDRMVQAFVETARLNPNITFVYRCHPVWVHPNHQGVNSIVRVAEYFEKTGLGNIKLSGNIPQTNEGNFTVTYPRSSLEEDLKCADIVFGDHSVSMIDAAMQGTLLASVNVMNRQNLFESMTALGFPHCTSVQDIDCLLKNIACKDFVEKYKKAIENYNNMTDKE